MYEGEARGFKRPYLSNYGGRVLTWGSWRMCSLYDAAVSDDALSEKNVRSESLDSAWKSFMYRLYVICAS